MTIDGDRTPWTPPGGLDRLSEVFTRGSQILGGRAGLLDAFVEALPVAIAYYDRKLIFQLANPAYARWANRPLSAVIGRHYFEVFPGTEATMGVILHEVIETGRPYRSQRFRFQYHDDTGIHVSFWDLIHLPSFDPQGRVEGILTIASDVTPHIELEQEMARRAQALQESEERFRAVFEKASIGIAIVDLQGRVVRTNHALQTMLGYTAQELVGMADERLLQAEDRAGDRRQFDAMLAGEREAYQQEVRLVRRDGTTLWGQLIASLARNIQAEPQFVIRMIEDVSERKAAVQQLANNAERLSQANARLKELDRLKGIYVDSVTHELKSPLTSVLGFAELLLDEYRGPLNPTQQEFVRQIEQGARRMEYLVSDLVDFARMEAGTFHLSPEPADFVAKVHEIVRSLRPQADATGVQLTVTDPGKPVELRMDARRIGQVLINLLTNAIKFTPAKGTIQVRVGVQGDRVRCEIQDSGVGIAPEDIPKLFQLYSRLEGPTRKTGTGLGLYISQALVQAHGGQIGVVSAPGQGSTFWFTLPLHPA